MTPCKKDHHQLINFKSSVPLKITEALVSSEVLESASANISESGWIWVVTGRRLLIWNFGQSYEEQVNFPCRELSLPASELAYSAKLISVFSLKDQLMPLCIAVSPEGMIRYWPNIVHESSYLDKSAELQGQECDSVLSLLPYGCLLATTTGNVLILTTGISRRHYTINCRILKSAGSILGGFSRRLSSLIFGSIPSQAIETILIKLVVVSQLQNDKLIYVLCNDSLKKWCVKVDDHEELLHSYDIQKLLKENFISSIWGKENCEHSHINIRLLDMTVHDLDLFILAVCNKVQKPELLYIGLGLVKINGPVPLISLPQFWFLQFAFTPEELLQTKLFVLNSNSVILYLKKHVLCGTLSPSGQQFEELDHLCLSSDRNFIIGAGIYKGLPLFMTFLDGLLMLQGKLCQEKNISLEFDQHLDITFNPLNSFQKHLSHIDASKLSQSQDISERIWTAFLLFLQKKVDQCNEILSSTFENNINSSFVNSNLDSAVLQFSSSLLDDKPIHDPRWLESFAKSEGSLICSTSLLILQQLEQKFQAHELFLKFLKCTHLWEKFTVTSVNNINLSTYQLLIENSEKIVCAIALKKIQAQYPDLINNAIIKVNTCIRLDFPKGELTHQDVFFTKISCIQDFITTLVDYTEEMLKNENQFDMHKKLILSANKIVLTILQEAVHYREQKKLEYDFCLHNTNCEYISWIGGLRGEGLQPALIKLYHLNLNWGIKMNENDKELIHEQLMEIVDLILNCLKCHLESVNDSKLTSIYENERKDLIIHFLKEKQYCKCVALAEKYEDFDILIQLLYSCDMQDRLEHYLQQFYDTTIFEHLFNWCYSNGKFQELMALCMKHQEKMGPILKTNPMLEWLNDMQTGNYLNASKGQKVMAMSEENSLSKKKALLYLSKLSAKLSGSEDSLLEDIEWELGLVKLQETLPQQLIELYGMNKESMKVMTPCELIQIFISEDNLGINPLDFRKALNVLRYIADKKEQKELQSHIWSKSILCNQWDSFAADDIVRICEASIFFRTLEMCIVHNDTDMIMKPSEILSCEELGNLRYDSKFQYIIQAGYEHLGNSVSIDFL